MKTHIITISLYFFCNFIIASEIVTKACPSGCGSIEHVFSKSIVKKYAEQNPNSGLIINNDYEEVPKNIIEAVIAFGQDTLLLDKTGQIIIPQPFKDTNNMVLPMYQSDDFNLRKSIVATIALDDTSIPSEILQRCQNQYKVSKNAISQYATIQKNVIEDGIIICQPCTTKKK